MSLERIGQRALRIQAERKARAQEALALYRPLPAQEPFFRSLASERIVRGGNRSGKTMSAAVEVASAATGIPVTAADGGAIPFKYPADRPLTIWVFGWDQMHIGKTVYRMLFRPNAFSVIRDTQTGLWRPFQPWDPLDKAREKQAKPAPPLIPKRFIDPNGWAWENKGQRVFLVCRLKSRWEGIDHGTEIYAFSSKGAVPAGDPCDLIWIDENIVYPEYIPELQARLSDRKGRLIWSSLPYMTNSALMEMSERAAEQAGREKPDVEEFRLRYADNPFIDADEKRKRIEGWSEAERRMRDDGDFVTDTITMYPEYSRHTHDCPAQYGHQDDAIDKAVRDNGGRVPDGWCCFLGLDPGHARPAVVFAAVPPPELGHAVVIFDELCPQRVGAEELAELVKAKATGRAFEAFVCDPYAGRQTPMGAVSRIHEQYGESFKKAGLKCRQTGHGFQLGSTNVPASLGIVRAALESAKGQRPILRVMKDRCPNLVRQIESYRKKVSLNVVQDDPAPNQRDDLVDALRYLVAFGPEYHKPAKELLGGRAWRLFQRLQKEKEGVKDKTVYMGPVA